MNWNHRSTRALSLSFPAALLTVWLLATGALEAQIVLYEQNFNGFANGTTDLGDGSLMLGTAEILDNSLQLTPEAPVSFATFWIPPVAASAEGWIATFDYSIGDTTGPMPADGFSFNYGNVPAVLSDFGEEGFPGIAPIISFEFDTWANGDDDIGPAISVNSVNINQGSRIGEILAPKSFIDGQIEIVLQADGTTSFNSTGAITNAQFNDLGSGFNLNEAFAFAFAARTGGANEDLRIDNLVITTIETIVPVDFVEPITSIALVDSTIQLSIPTAPGRQIGIEYTADISSGTWIDLGNFFPDSKDSNINLYIDPDEVRTSRSSGFYRAFLRPLTP